MALRRRADMPQIMRASMRMSSNGAQVLARAFTRARMVYNFACWVGDKGEKRRGLRDMMLCCVQYDRKIAQMHMCKAILQELEEETERVHDT